MSQDDYIKDLQDALNGVMLCYGLPELAPGHDILMRLHYYRQRNEPKKAVKRIQGQVSERPFSDAIKLWEAKRGGMTYFVHDRTPCRFLGYTEEGYMKVIMWAYRDPEHPFSVHDLTYDGRFRLRQMVETEENQAFNVLSRLKVSDYADPLDYCSAADILNEGKWQ